MRNPIERLKDILEAITAIEKYKTKNRAEFENDEMLQVWFLRHLEIIGEAASKIPEEVRKLSPDIPREKIKGMRNVLVHGYFEIDRDIVWETVQKDIPVLKAMIEELLSRLQEHK